MEFNLGEMLRIAEKQKLEGRDALTDDELYRFAGFQAIARRYARWALGRTAQQRANSKAGYEIFKSLPPDEQEKYQDWTPQQLQALWSLIKEQGEEETS